MTSSCNNLCTCAAGTRNPSRALREGPNHKHHWRVARTLFWGDGQAFQSDTDEEVAKLFRYQEALSRIKAATVALPVIRGTGWLR